MCVEKKGFRVMLETKSRIIKSKMPPVDKRSQGMSGCQRALRTETSLFRLTCPLPTCVSFSGLVCSLSRFYSYSYIRPSFFILRLSFAHPLLQHSKLWALPLHSNKLIQPLDSRFTAQLKQISCCPQQTRGRLVAQGKCLFFTPTVIFETDLSGAAVSLPLFSEKADH